jgi:hypothetical protein
MKKWLICLLSLLGLITVLVATTSASDAKDVSSPKLLLNFTSVTDAAPPEEVLNSFVIVSQDILDKASPILYKALDKSSPKLYEMDKSSPELFKTLDKASPKLLDDHKKWIELASSIPKGPSYSASVTSAQNTNIGQITITSDSSKITLTSQISWVTANGENISQKVTMIGDLSSKVVILKFGLDDDCNGSNDSYDWTISLF